VAARDPHFFPEQQLPHHRPRAILLWEADEADHVEDVGDHVATKLTALLEHRSQYPSTHRIDDPGDETQVAAFRQRMEERLAEMGALAGVAAGEAFKRIDRV
jgi:LmbE family N-acetylglucosaminyl deacetylase